MELRTDRFKLKELFPDKANKFAQKLHVKADQIDFVRKGIPIDPGEIKIEEGERACVRLITTPHLDRDGEILIPRGAILDDFRQSPSVLYGHDYKSLPIGSDQWIKLTEKGILAKTQYASHQFAEDVYQCVKDGHLNSNSVGFIPVEAVTPDEKDQFIEWQGVLEKEYGISNEESKKAHKIYTKWIMLEHSDVPVPSNAQSLNLAVSKGDLPIKSKRLIKDLEIEIKDFQTDSDLEIIDFEPEDTEIENFQEVSTKCVTEDGEKYDLKLKLKTKKIDEDNATLGVEEITITTPETEDGKVKLTWQKTEESMAVGDLLEERMEEIEAKDSDDLGNVSKEEIMAMADTLTTEEEAELEPDDHADIKEILDWVRKNRDLSSMFYRMLGELLPQKDMEEEQDDPELTIEPDDPEPDLSIADIVKAELKNIDLAEIIRTEVSNTIKRLKGKVE